MKAFLPVLILLASPPAHAQPGWGVEVLSGSVYNFPTTLAVRQSGHDRISFTARYDTRPLENPLYYIIRLGRQTGQRVWELELIHQKLFLTNPPSEIQEFSITHGYNLLFVNRVWELAGFLFRLGPGIVIAHPENTVRERKLTETRGLFKRGYYLSGLSVQKSLVRET